MFNVRNVWSMVGASFALVALYLVLEHGTAASRVIGAGGTFAEQFYKTLQGRD